MKKKSVVDAWGKTQLIIKDETTKSSYNKVEPLVVYSHDDHIINILADPLDVDWLNARVSKTASKHISGILGQPMQILFAVNGSPPKAAAVLSQGRKAQLDQAYGETRASIIQPHKTLYITSYYWNYWRPLLGKGTASDVVIACRSLCYWNIKTGELRNTITTDRGEIGELAGCSPSSVDRALNHQLVRMYFVRKKIARVMTEAGPRNHGLILKVRMDDPLIPIHQQQHKINEPMSWVNPYFPDES